MSNLESTEGKFQQYPGLVSLRKRIVWGSQSLSTLQQSSEASNMALLCEFVPPDSTALCIVIFLVIPVAWQLQFPQLTATLTVAFTEALKDRKKCSQFLVVFNKLLDVNWIQMGSFLAVLLVTDSFQNPSSFIISCQESPCTFFPLTFLHFYQDHIMSTVPYHDAAASKLHLVCHVWVDVQWHCSTKDGVCNGIRFWSHLTAQQYLTRFFFSSGVLCSKEEQSQWISTCCFLGKKQSLLIPEPSSAPFRLSRFSAKQ